MATNIKLFVDAYANTNYFFMCTQQEMNAAIGGWLQVALIIKAFHIPAFYF